MLRLQSLETFLGCLVCWIAVIAMILEVDHLAKLITIIARPNHDRQHIFLVPVLLTGLLNLDSASDNDIVTV